MNPNQLAAKISGTTVEGKMVGVYVCFQPGLRAAETLHFESDNTAHVNIDVDADDNPIGIEFVHPNAPADELSRELNLDPTEILDRLRTAASMLILAYRAQYRESTNQRQMELGDAILQEALDGMHDVERANLVGAV